MKLDFNGNKKVRVLGGVILAVIAWLVYYLVRQAIFVTTDDAYVEGRIYTIASKIPGTVKKVYVEDNQTVKKSDMLLELDPVDYQVKVNEAEAVLKAEQSRLANSQAAENAAQANLELQKATLSQAELDYQRAERLFQEGAIAQEKLDRARTARTLAQSQVKASTEQITQAQTAVDLENALLKQREATLKAVQLNLSYTKISAPADGNVTKKSVEAGNQVQPGQPLMAVVSLNDIWVVANYKETQLKKIHPGQRVKVKVDTYPHKIFTGKVDSIMAGTGAVFSLFPPENALGSYVKVVQRIPVKIVLDQNNDSQHLLRVGMSVIPTILTRDE